MRTSTLEQLRRHLRPGRVYRREDLLPWSHSVDRHLKELTVDGTLQKLRTGLYYSPRKFEFGEAPADEHELVKAFLKTDRFVVTSPNAYNQLGLGTTQLYNKRVVYNQKRHGTFPLGNRMVTFERRMNVPRQLSPEFLLVDLVNELGDLAEDRDAVLSRVREKAKEMDPKKLSRAVSLYGKYSTQKKFQEMLQHAADSFLHERSDFKALVETVADSEKINDPALVEKDYWIMHAVFGLKQLGLTFELKGGTSLSKGFGIIQRFSEDIDIRIEPFDGLQVDTNPNHEKPKHIESRRQFL